MALTSKTEQTPIVIDDGGDAQISVLKCLDIGVCMTFLCGAGVDYSEWTVVDFRGT